MPNTNSFQAPEGSLVRRELRALRELPRLVANVNALRSAPQGESNIMVLPGYSTNDAAMSPLRWYLRTRGHNVIGWGLGTNRGDVAGNLPAVMEQVKRFVTDCGDRPVVLIGWSLGGVFAREVARDRPELVRRVITMATPIYGGPRYTVSAGNYSEAELDTIETTIDARNPDLIERSITAFYTEYDGAVDWRACIDDINPNVTMIEVASSHLGITFDPTVWGEIARRLV